MFAKQGKKSPLLQDFQEIMNSMVFFGLPLMGFYTERMGLKDKVYEKAYIQNHMKFSNTSFKTFLNTDTRKYIKNMAIL